MRMNSYIELFRDYVNLRFWMTSESWKDERDRKSEGYIL